MNDTVLIKNIRIAYLISIPIGFFTVLFVFALPVAITGEGLPTMLIVSIYGWAIIGLLIFFIFAINYGSKKAHNKILKGKSLLLASFSFSFSINNIIWLTFISLTVVKWIYDKFMFSEVNSNDSVVFIILYYLLFPVIAYIISVIGTTFTLGLIISKIFKNNIVNYQKSN